MTAQRPNAIVFQEYANLTVTPDIPDLNVLIVGPAKQLLDYADDKADCYAAEYGAYQANCPATDPTAVIIASPPNIKAGGLLDSSAVTVYLDVAEVIVVASPDPIALSVGVYTSGDNLFEAHTDVGGQHFGSAEVAVGDTGIIGNAGTDNYIMTVKELCYTLHDHTAAVDFRDVTDPVQPGDIVTLANDTDTTSRDGTYVVKRVTGSNTLEVVAASWVGSFLAAGFTADLTVTDPYGSPRAAACGTAVPLADYCNIRMTSDFTSTAVFGDGYDWRIERTVNDIELDAADFSINNNTITVDSAITVDLSDTIAGSNTITYAKIYVQYAAFRTDLQTPTTLSNYAEIETLLGKYDARNPLFVGAVVAKANTTTPVKVYGVPADTLPEYLEFLDRISTERDVYAIVPLTYSTSILATINSSCENLADPNYVLTAGIKQKFRVVIGAMELQTTKYIVNTVGGGVSSLEPVTAPTGNKTGTVGTTGTSDPQNVFSLGIIPGDVFEIYDAAPTPTTVSYTVVQTNSKWAFEAAGAISTLTLNGAGDYTRFTRGGVEIPGSKVTVGGGVTDVSITASVLDNLCLVLSVPTAAFLTNGCIPGDVLQIPQDPTVNSWTATPSEWLIDEVISNQKVRIVNSGNNTVALETELPHGGKRTDGSEILTGLYCRVMRNMDKTQQISDMVATAQSFSSRRTLLCYPDLVDVTSLVDGSKPRVTDGVSPEAADPQPGYYLACAVGGQTAGNPPHQGFTNVGIAGIDRIYNSIGYFNEEQLTDLSNGGLYVFVQDTPTSLPKTIHEVTTDVSALEFSEYMVVKNFDFVAWTFLDTLLPFIGPWNVTPETIEFIRQALFTTGDNLKARKVSKLGAPLTDYQLDSVEESSQSRDRIEAYMQVNLPMTLNTIGLHLVA